MSIKFLGMGKSGFLRTYESMSFKTLNLERFNKIKFLDVAETACSPELCAPLMFRSPRMVATE